jgi:DNA end-binding protein Ku
MRPLWKGSVSFGLVNIPVGLYSATKSGTQIKFHLLRDSDSSPIRYKRVAETDGKEVDWEHIVKGFEYQKGEYIVLTEEDFQRVQLKSTQVVDIREFVDLADIDPRFFDEPYYLAPEKGGAKAYGLLRQALEKSGKAGIAKVVIRPPREHLAAVKPLDGMLTLEIMHFPDELRDPAELQVPSTTGTQKELDMALTLIKSMSGQWEPENYHDEYREALLNVIEQKLQAKEKGVPMPKPQRGKAPAKVVDLVSILQDSINQMQAGQKPSKGGKARRTVSKTRKAA